MGGYQAAPVSGLAEFTAPVQRPSPALTECLAEEVERAPRCLQLDAWAVQTEMLVELSRVRGAGHVKMGAFIAYISYRSSPFLQWENFRLSGSDAPYGSG